VTENAQHNQTSSIAIAPDGPAGTADLETLGRIECLNLLALAQVGRVAFVVDGRPEILPVNYALDGDAVLFRTSAQSVLNQASLTNVAFEVDCIDTSTQSGWSVVVHGHADDIGDAIDPTSERLRRLVLVTWAPGQRQSWFVIRPHTISGRRLRVLPLEL
jgi:nitroimidazol reductase NimA-like FMN-containing flavoprotein (pyridoxamine 5'-phosphate oxidase superfamily)